MEKLSSKRRVLEESGAFGDQLELGWEIILHWHRNLGLSHWYDRSWDSTASLMSFQILKNVWACTQLLACGFDLREEPGRNFVQLSLKHVIFVVCGRTWVGLRTRNYFIHGELGKWRRKRSHKGDLVERDVREVRRRAHRATW